ncbi:MAG: tyrosine-type recombinase/integrase, partial [Planctomycetaceae bacterium]
MFKRKRVVTDPETGQRTEKSDKKYSIEYRDEHGRKRRKVIASDKSVAARKLADALREIEKKKAGETDPFEEHRKKPLDVHLEEYGLHQRSRGTSIEQVLLVRGRVLSILDGCGFMFPGDIKNDPVQHFLYDQRNDRLSAQTCNHYITAIRQFVTWMVDRGRLTTNPIADLKKFDVKTDRRHDRRPLSSDEFVRLIQAARSGESVENVPGPERAICYLVSASTGFRRKELASLRRGSLILSTGVSLVTLEAEFAKNGKKASIPIQDHVGREIERWLSSRGPLKTTSYVFSLRTAGGKLRKTSKMMKM